MLSVSRDYTPMKSYFEGVIEGKMAWCGQPSNHTAAVVRLFVPHSAAVRLNLTKSISRSLESDSDTECVSRV